MERPTAFESARWRVETRIAATPDDLHKVFAVRACCFLAEEESLTYDDEFGVNDYVGTHLLALVDGDAAGVIRIRYFSEFAMLERIGVRKRYRTFKVFKALARAAMELVAQKGYRIVVGRARGSTDKLWARLINAEPSGPRLEVSRGILTPMIRYLEPRADSLVELPFGDARIEHQIVQPEGKWDFAAIAEARAEARISVA